MQSQFSLQGRERFDTDQEGNVTTEAKCYTTCSTDGKGGHVLS